MSNGKSPGLDGLTFEFYKHFWSDIKHMILDAFRECIKSSNMSSTMKQGLITLLPKPNKDTLLLNNWRPVALLGSDYKLLAMIFANRLK